MTILLFYLDNTYIKRCFALKCPYCKNDMQEGYVPFNSPFVLKWVSLLNSQKMRISDRTSWFETSKIKNVHFCKACNLFIKKM